MFNFAPRGDRGPSGARGWRAYVVGDIHGRLDLLDQLLDTIHTDIGNRKSRKVLLVFVGDLIDRGPDSAKVIERLRTYRHRAVRTMFLLGNHEEVLLRILDGEAELITKWRWFGGTECLNSYGVDTAKIGAMSEADALDVVRSAIPKEHVDFLESFDDSCRFGDYLFVHAGIRPGVEIDQQTQADLRWNFANPSCSTTPITDLWSFTAIPSGRKWRCGPTGLELTPGPIERACSRRLR